MGVKVAAGLVLGGGVLCVLLSGGVGLSLIPRPGVWRRLARLRGESVDGQTGWRAAPAWWWLLGCGAAWLLGGLAASLAVVAAGGLAWLWWAGRAEAARTARVDEGLERACLATLEVLRAGQGLVRALEEGGGRAGGPLGEELVRLARQAQVGEPLGSLLKQAAAGASRSDLRLFYTALEIHRRCGGSPAPVLGSLGEAVRQRRLLRGEMRARSAEARLTAWFLALTPVGLALFLGLTQRTLLVAMLGEPTGVLGVVYAAASWVAGIAVCHALISGEERAVQR